VPLGRLRAFRAVQAVVPVKAPYRLASREVFDRDTLVRVEPRSDGSRWSGIEVGGRAPIALIVGFGGITEDGRLRPTVDAIHGVGGSLIHAGRFSGDPPGSGDTAGWKGQELRTLADELGFGVCMEVADSRFVDEASSIADVLEVGSRSMQDFNLLRTLGQTDRPVIVKRGLGATVEEFLLAAEYVLTHGNGRVILCESGIRTFDATSRPRFEINAIPVIKGATHLPVVADPSHSSDPAWVPAVARAAIAAGADGLMINLSDRGSRAGVDLLSLKALVSDLAPIAVAVGRRF
jgi:3-deoxy-7-phosphoheptulonate synthase